MAHGHISLRYRNQTGQAALAGEQVVVAVENQRFAYRIAQAEQPAAFVVQKPHVDAIGQTVRSCRQFAQIPDGLRRVFSRLNVGHRNLLEPRGNFRPQVGISAVRKNGIHGGRRSFRH